MSYIGGPHDQNPHEKYRALKINFILNITIPIQKLQISKICISIYMFFSFKAQGPLSNTIFIKDDRIHRQYSCTWHLHTEQVAGKHAKFSC